MPRRPEFQIARNYSDEEREFLVALDRWRRATGVKFPHATDILAIAVALGYRKVEPPGPLPEPRPWK